MARVNGCPPDAQADDAEEQAGVPALMAQHGIDGGEQHIGGMQAWHGGKDIRILAI